MNQETFIDKDLFFELSRKYDYAEGRYNYYPRITSWANNLDSKAWQEELARQANQEIDLYIHIPFCQKFCFFCGCNIKTGTPSLYLDDYLSILEQEWQFYSEFNFKIKNIYLGGGTPNSLNLSQTKRLLNNFQGDFKLHIEYDPRFHNLELLEYLVEEKNLCSISMGIQDLDPKVLSNIGRHQTADYQQNQKQCFEDLQRFKLEHVSIDILYGAPGQTSESAKLLANFLSEQTAITGISLYPFAQVPWFKEYNPMSEGPLLKKEQKIKTHFEFTKLFNEMEYKLISFGHYVKKGSAFLNAFEENKLQRTVMGFCLKKSENLIGLGVSAISSTRKCLKQNHKIYENYVKWPTTIQNGHFRDPLEIKLEQDFLDLSSKKRLQFTNSDKVCKTIMSKNNEGQYSIRPIQRHFLQYNIRQLQSAMSDMTEN